MAEPVHRAEAEQRIQRAILTQDLLEPDRADKRRKNHRHQHQAADQFLAGEIEAVGEQGQRHGDQRDERCRAERDQEAVEQSLGVDGVLEHAEQVFEREPAADEEAAADRCPERRKQQYPEQDAAHYKNQSGQSSVHDA